MLFDVDDRRARAAFDRAFDVCVIGAGPAGITLARRLAGRGLDVALMEGGGLEWSEEIQALAVGESVGLTYPDLDVARVRCLRRLVGALERPLPRLRGRGHAAAAAEPRERLADRQRRSRPLRGGGRRDPRPRPGRGDVPPRPPAPPRTASDAGLVPRSAPTRFGEKYLDEITDAAADRARRPRQPRRPPPRRRPRPASTGAVFRGYAAGRSRLHRPGAQLLPLHRRHREPAAAAQLHQPDPGGHRQPATTWSGATSATTCACRSAR